MVARRTLLISHTIIYTEEIRPLHPSSPESQDNGDTTQDTIGGNEHLSHEGTLAVDGGTTDESPSGPWLSANRMYSTFSRFAGLKSID